MMMIFGGAWFAEKKNYNFSFFIYRQEIPLTTTSKAFEVWNDTSALPPMYFKIRFFNWTNPEELRMPGKKPNFVELGPYVFR